MRLLEQQIAGRSHALIRQCRRYANGISTYRATVRIQQAQDHQSRAPFRRRRAIRAEGRGSRSKIRTRRRRRRRRFTGPDVIEIIMLREKKRRRNTKGSHFRPPCGYITRSIGLSTLFLLYSRTHAKISC